MVNHSGFMCFEEHPYTDSDWAKACLESPETGEFAFNDKNEIYTDPLPVVAAAPTLEHEYD